MTVIGVWTVVWALARLPKMWPLTFLEWLGQFSIVTYLVHVPVLRVMVNYLGWPRDTWVGFLSLAVAGLLVCIVSTSCYPSIRWLFELRGARHARSRRTRIPPRTARPRSP